MMTKKCTKCGVEKTIEYFSKDKSSKDGYCLQCKDCRKKYNDSNKEKIKDLNKKWHSNHKEKVSERHKKQYRINIEIVNKRHKEYNKLNKEKIKQYRKQYGDKNKEKIKQMNKDYQNERRKNDFFYKFKLNIRSLVKNALTRFGYSKSSHTYEILKIGYQDCLNYLFKKAKLRYTDFESKDFLEKNKYHIDHIVPLATAKTEEDVIRLCHYTNLQLLTAKDNLEKSSYLDWE